MAKRIITKSISAVVNDKFTLTLFGIEVYEGISDETLAMSAKVALNGKEIGYVMNRGCGEGNYPNVKPEFREEYQECEEAVKSHHYYRAGTPDYPYTCDWDYCMDFLIACMVEQFHYEKRKIFEW